MAKKYFHVERPKLGLRLAYQFEEETRKGPDIDTKNTLHDFRERLDFETAGWVYHPGLLKYLVGFQPEFIQLIEEQDAAGGGESKGTRNDFLPGYFLDATFLELKPYTLNLFGRRYNTTVRSALAQVSDTAVDTYGADMMLKYKTLPTTFTYTHTKSAQEGFFTSTEESEDVRLRTRHQSKKSDTQLNATYNDSLRTSSGIPTKVKSAYNDLRNNYNITGDRRVVLNSSLLYRWTESNSLDSSGIRLSENLFWNHRENLRSFYNLTYVDQTSGGSETKTTSLDGRLTHRLYDNLTTTFGGGLSLSDFTGGGEDKYAVGVDFDYRRNIPLGLLNLSAGYDYEATTRDITQRFLQIIDEPHILRTGVVTFLANINVAPDSIVVTNVAGSIIYVEDIDYTLEEVDSFVRINRTAFGAIADGQTVLIDYRYLSDPSYDDAVFGQSYGISYFPWSMLLLSFRYDRPEQKILAGPPPENIINDRIRTTEARFNWRGLETRLSYEDADRTSGVSTEGWRAEQIITLRPAGPFFFRLSGNAGKTVFKESGNEERFYGITSVVDWAPARWSRFRLEGVWNDVEGTTRDTVDNRVSFEVELRYGIWSGNFTYRYIDQKDKLFGESRINQYILFEILRTVW